LTAIGGYSTGIFLNRHLAHAPGWRIHKIKENDAATTLATGSRSADFLVEAWTQGKSAGISSAYLARNGQKNIHGFLGISKPFFDGQRRRMLPFVSPAAIRGSGQAPVSPVPGGGPASHFAPDSAGSNPGTL